MHNNVSKKMKKKKVEKATTQKSCGMIKIKYWLNLIFYFQILSNDIILVYPVLY